MHDIALSLIKARMLMIDVRAGQVREIYETAVEAEPPYALSDADCKTMCLRYARLEKQVCSCRGRLRIGRRGVTALSALCFCCSASAMHVSVLMQQTVGTLPFWPSLRSKSVST